MRAIIDVNFSNQLAPDQITWLLCTSVRCDLLMDVVETFEHLECESHVGNRRQHYEFWNFGNREFGFGISRNLFHQCSCCIPFCTCHPSSKNCSAHPSDSQKWISVIYQSMFKFGWLWHVFVFVCVCLSVDVLKSTKAGTQIRCTMKQMEHGTWWWWINVRFLT